jgi:hypothetical protein
MKNGFNIAMSNALVFGDGMDKGTNKTGGEIAY